MPRMHPVVRLLKTRLAVAMLNGRDPPAEYANPVRRMLIPIHPNTRENAKFMDRNFRRSTRDVRYATGAKYIRPMSPAATIPAVAAPTSVPSGDKRR